MAKLVSKVYGEALFEAAVDHGNAIQLMNETAQLEKILEDNPDFDKLMKHPGIPKQEKLSMVEQVFRGRVSDDLTEFLKIVVTKERYGSLKAIFAYFTELVRESEKMGTAYVDTAVELTEAQKVRLMAAIDELKEIYDAGGCPCSVTAPDGKPVEYTFFRPQQYGEKYLIKEWPSFNAMLEGYYAEKDRAERLRTKSKELHKAVHNMYERAVRKQAARQEELAASGKSDKLRLYGELLSANLYLAEKGMKSITVPNWYDEGREVTIPLDLRFSPSQNAQNFFKNYKKKQTAARMLVDLLAEGEKEIAYLETVLYEVETASGEAALNEIRAELKSQGYLKYYKQRDKRQKPADFLRFTSSDGFEILVGRNNAQNDKLTLHTARGKDLWFHVQKAPGSHVVVMSRGEDIPDTTRQEAAELAVVYSSTFKAGAAAKVAVDTTEVKNIWKANGAKPGMVLYEVYTTVYVTPREKLLDELKANAKK